MADVTERDFSLMSLEEELTCSICLSTFDCPVTIPCGHNFCQDCLLATWKDSYSCPQCCTMFATKPELKKNMVLSTVVNTYKSGSSKGEAGVDLEKSKPEKADVIRCDTCMEAEAAQTCLTCMVSFCEEHLRPHKENPKFSVHQLTEPLGDLLERICPDHHKLMELFCTQHSRPICSLCLQQVHKGCSFKTPEEQRNLQESDFRDKMGLLDVKIERTVTVLLQMNDQQTKLMDAATNKKTALAATYQQIRDMLVTEERKAQQEVDCELEIARTKLRDLTKKFTENAEGMRRARDEINSLMSQSHTLAFLQASYELPKTVKFDPYPPRINLDSKKVLATQAFSVALKENLTETFEQPVETRQLILPPDEKENPVYGAAKSAGTGDQSASDHSHPQTKPRSKSPFRSVVQPIFQPVPVPIYINQQTNWNQSHNAPGFQRHPPPISGQKSKQEKNTQCGAGGQSYGAGRGQKQGGAGGQSHGAGRGQTQGGAGGQKGFDSSKKHSPGGGPSSGKPTKPNPQPKKKS